MKAKLYIQGKVCTAELINTDKTTYIAPVHVFIILEGDRAGEKVAVFENSDKFMEWES